MGVNGRTTTDGRTDGRMAEKHNAFAAAEEA